MGQQPSESISQAARNVAAALVDAGCWLLAFDMDQCLVNAHSHGKLRRDELNDYLAKVTPSFVALATAIHEQNESGEAMHKIHLAIATHSDALEHTDLTPPETHIMGDDLAHAVLDASLPPIIAEKFHVVCWNPRVRRKEVCDEDALKGKNFHVRKLAKACNVPLRTVVLLDDCEDNILLTNGTLGNIAVDPNTGLNLLVTEPITVPGAIRNLRPPWMRQVNQASQFSEAPHVDNSLLHRDILLGEPSSDRSSNSRRVFAADLLAALSAIAGIAAGALFVASSFDLPAILSSPASPMADITDLRHQSAAMLYDVFIPFLSIVALLVATLLLIRAIARRATEKLCTENNGTSMQRHQERRRRKNFGRKSLIVSGASVLFAFSCVYRAFNVADEGAATCRGPPTYFNAPVAGRFVATVGEVSLVIQLSIYITSTADRLGAQQGLWSKAFRRFTTIRFSTLLPVVTAEIMSWTGVLSGNSKFFCAEYVLWMCIAITWVWDGAELLHKSTRFSDQFSHACLLMAGIGLFAFNALLEIPHFFTYSRKIVEAGASPETSEMSAAVPQHIGIWECHQDINSPLWVKRLPFFFCYFIGCSWCSAAISYRFLSCGAARSKHIPQ